ncbi:MAG TPA: hypothetical protein VIH43_04270 [Chthoniobacterales bacterium]
MINIVADGVLSLLTVGRLTCFVLQRVADLVDYGRGPEFFTEVAATCVLGIQIVILTKNRSYPGNSLGSGNDLLLRPDLRLLRRDNRARE